MAEKQTPHDIYDRGYKLLLSFTKIFQQLMEGYVQGDWKSRLDYTKSQRIEKTFILKGLEKQEADVLYKVPLLGEEGKEVYLYVLIEQQSTVDYTLAFRVLCYLVAIWTEIYKNTDENVRRQKGFRLPPVLPIVLYNGALAWTATTSVKDLVEYGELFGDFIPSVRYHLIDIPRYSEEKLKQIGNSLAGVFLLEHERKSKEEFETNLKEALAIIGQEPDKELWKEIIQWIVVLLKRVFPEKGELLENLDFEKHKRKEIQSMLETMHKKLVGWGRDEGRQQGIREVAINLLKEGMEISLISRATGLSEKEIIALKREIAKN